MQRSLWRALMLTASILLIVALPVAAQTTDDLPGLAQADSSVLIGIQNDIDLASGEEADGIVVVQSSGTVAGTAKGLVMVDGEVTVASGGSIDSIFAVGGSLTIEPGGSVRDLAYVNTTITGEENVTGQVNDLQTDLAGAVGWIAAALFIFLIFLWIGFGLAVLFSALIAVAFGTSQLRRAAWTIGNDVLKVLVAGLIMLIVPWIVFGLLAVTVVGIPLAVGLMVLWGFVAFLGYLVVGLWIGERILSRSRTANRPYGAAFLGVLILMLLSWIPLVTPIALWFGIGAVTLAGWRVLRSGGTPPYGVPAYGQPWGQPMQVPPPPYAPPPYAPPPYVPPTAQPPAQWPPQGGPPANWS